MFRSLRWRLTIWFMLLSMLVYATLVGLGMAFFHNGLTNALDDELMQLSQELLPTLEYETPIVHLNDYPPPHGRHKRNPILRLLASIQLFDQQGSLIQAIGPKGVDKLVHGTIEIKEGDLARRSMSTPIVYDNKLLGYLQVQLPTRLRDAATWQFGFTMAVIAPLIFLALGVSGYFFAGKAVEPIEETVSVLRRFVADASHELGTPIATIQAATENLIDQLGDTNHVERLGIIARTTERMGRLVQDLMLLAKVDGPKISPKRDVVNLDELLSQCMQDFQDRFDERNIALKCDELAPLSVIGNQDSLHRVVTNLLENALRHTSEGGTVTVSVKPQGRSARLSVEDTGCGIPAESLPYVFDRFYRVDKSRSRDAGGAGLGLSIVKAIVQSYKGSVEVSSEIGQGTRFSVLMPATSPSQVGKVET